jgi:ATP-dependent exoDNAse (exonuclease V) alpha subunit
VELNDIRRQQSETDRQVVRDLAAGNADAAILSLESRNLITQAGGMHEVINALVQDWRHDVHPVENRLILTGTRAEASSLNHEVRQVLRDEGVLGDVSADFEVAGGVVKTFSEGDRILFTRNHLGMDVRNGTLGTLLRVEMDRHGECELSVRTDDGKIVRFSPTAADGYNHLDHGYAMSVHKAQGVTVSSCYLLASEIMGDREWAYVGASRAKGETRLYCTAEMRESLEQTFSRSRQKTSSLDYQMHSGAGKVHNAPARGNGQGLELER